MVTTAIPETRSTPIAPPATAKEPAAPPDPALAPAPETLLVGELRLNLSALGVDHRAPDFGERFCRMTGDNASWQFEYSAQGELIVMPMPGEQSVHDEAEVGGELYLWRRGNGGMSYGANIGFHLPSGAVRAPDAAWISQERYDSLTLPERRGTINGAPDFLVEIRSRTDRLPPFLGKLAEWMAAGAKLGWGIDPRHRRAYIYRAGQDEPEILDNPETLSGEDVLPGFVFAVRRLIFDRYTDE